MQHQKKDYQHTAVGWIPKDWVVKELGELVDKKRPVSYGIVQTGALVPNGVKCVRVLDLVNGRINPEGLITTSEKISLSYKRTVLKEGDLVLALRGKIGELAIVQEALSGANLTRGVALIAPDKNYDSRFLYQQLSSPHQKKILEQSLNGSALQELSIGVLRKVPIAIAGNLNEQRKIAAILSTWDKAIEKEQHLTAALQKRHRALARCLLSGKLRLEELVTEWKEVMLGEMFTEIKETNDGIGHAAMTISARHGLINQQDKFDRVIAGESLNKYTLLQNGDFAYNKGNSKLYEMGCVYQLQHTASAVVPFVYICFRPTNRIEATFYRFWFSEHGLDRQLKRIITSGARGDGLLNVNTTDFFKLTIPFPTIEEQRTIATILTASEKEISHCCARLAALQTQKRGLMQQLLTGKIRVNHE